MIYYILHNRQSAASREFVASLPEGAGHTVIEWYTEPGAVAEYMAAGGPAPSALHSVAARIPDVETGERIVPAHWLLLRCPVDLAEVDAAVARELEA